MQVTAIKVSNNGRVTLKTQQSRIKSGWEMSLHKSVENLQTRCRRNTRQHIVRHTGSQSALNRVLPKIRHGGLKSTWCGPPGQASPLISHVNYGHIFTVRAEKKTCHVSLV